MSEPRPLLLAMACALAAIASTARAQDTRIALCVPTEDDERTLRPAIESELGHALGACGASDADIDVRVYRDGVLEGLDVEARRRDGAARSERTRLPQDLVDVRAVAVIVASLVQALLRDPPPAEPLPAETLPAEPLPVEPAVAPVAPPEPAARTEPPTPAAPPPAEPSSRTLLGIGLTVAFGADARWLDAAATFRREHEGHALSTGADLRIHEPAGHGAMVSMRWGTFVFEPGPRGRESVHVDLRYSFRAAHDVLPLVLEVDAGLAVVVANYRVGGQVVEALGVGPVLALSGVLQLDAFVLGLELVYTGLFNSGDGVYGHGLELLLRTGFFADGAFAVGREPE